MTKRGVRTGHLGNAACNGDGLDHLTEAAGDKVDVFALALQRAHELDDAYRELISDIWGKRGATSGEKGGVSANFKKKTPGVSSSDGGCDASMLSSCERVGFITSSRLLSAYGDVRVGGGGKKGGVGGKKCANGGSVGMVVDISHFLAEGIAKTRAREETD